MDAHAEFARLRSGGGADGGRMSAERLRDVLLDPEYRPTEDGRRFVVVRLPRPLLPQLSAAFHSRLQPSTAFHGSLPQPSIIRRRR